MFSRLLSFAAALVIAGWATLATGPASEAVPPPRTTASNTRSDDKVSRPVFEVRLADETLIRVELIDPSLPVKTRYGNLTIPAGEVRRVDFGFRYPDGMEARIERAIANLGNVEFHERESAGQALAQYGHYAIPSLRRAARSENPEMVRRSQDLIRLLSGKLTPEKAELRDCDVIETAEFTIHGQIELGVLRVWTRYFGAATLRPTDIRAFRAVGAVRKAEIALDSARYAMTSQSEWLDTMIEVSSGQMLDVSASGEIDQWPKELGQHMCGPGGTREEFGQSRFKPGQVIGRIGASGNEFSIGEKFRGKISENGKLFLRIAPSPWGDNSSGSYALKVILSD